MMDVTPLITTPAFETVAASSAVRSEMQTYKRFLTEYLPLF